MKFEWTAVRREIRLGEYAAEMDQAVIRVTVNVSREVMLRVLSVSAETPDTEFIPLLRELWGDAEWPEEDIRALFEHCRENDPMLWLWLTKRTFELVLEYQGLVKKKLPAG